MNVEYKTGCIEIATRTGIYRISEIVEMYLICDYVKEFIHNNCVDETSFRAYVMVFDVLVAAKNKLIEYHETKTCPYPHYTTNAPQQD